MSKPSPRSALSLRLVLLACVAAAACFHKPNQYDPIQDPLFPQGGMSGGPGPAGGRGGGSSRANDGPEPSIDGEPSNQVCGNVCEAEKSDGCCPVGCTGASDIDCKAQCGNGVLEQGEQCDPPTSCPATCPSRGCTKFTLEGSAAECTAVCTESGKETACKPDDGCCPAGCTTTDDSDCAVICGNGAKEGSETCDPLASCPTTCPAEACQLKKLVNAGTCAAECVNDRLQTACMPGDGCCPPGCHTGNDSDCMAACDNGIKESGETCDPLSSCPATCPANECQLRKLNNPGTCKAQCVNDRLQTACQSGDDCCPPGCNTANDNDCGVRCGDGIKDASETCDPLATCPAQCPAMGCQLRELKNPGTCKAACENSRTQTACVSNDDCCPSACNANNDNDCQPRCGNNVKEAGEDCDGNCPTSCPRQGCRERRLENGGTCRATCVENGPSPDGTGCGNQQVCQDGACITKKTRGATCSQPLECQTGACINSHCCNSGEKFCDGQCRAGNYCCDGTPCNGIANGMGACSGGTCRRTGCNPGFKPQGDGCVDACSGISCPTCFSCSAGECRPNTSSCGIENGTGRCAGGTCTVADCNDGFRKDGTRCVRACVSGGGCPAGCGFEDPDCRLANNERCNGPGECRSNNCSNSVCCPPNQALIEGTCQTPCRPVGTQCRGNTLETCRSNGVLETTRCEGDGNSCVPVPGACETFTCGSPLRGDSPCCSDKNCFPSSQCSGGVCKGRRGSPCGFTPNDCAAGLTCIPNPDPTSPLLNICD